MKPAAAATPPTAAVPRPELPSPSSTSVELSPFESVPGVARAEPGFEVSAACEAKEAVHIYEEPMAVL